MGRFDRAVGLVRSLTVYHVVPLRQRRLRRLYGQFVRPGDLVFDIGAHVGNRVRAFAALGCRVVALEPQPDFARLLRAFFRRSAHVTRAGPGFGAQAVRGRPVPPPMHNSRHPPPVLY
jgi:hypothetical protein